MKQYRSVENLKLLSVKAACDVVMFKWEKHYYIYEIITQTHMT